MVSENQLASVTGPDTVNSPVDGNSPSPVSPVPHRSLIAALFGPQLSRSKTALALELAASLILGGAFVWAAVLKLQDPAGTLFAVRSYAVLPAIITHPAAIALPWLELWAGMATILGPGNFRRAGALILSLMLTLFMAVTALALARGLDFDCGCFGAGSGRPGATFFLRDLALLALGLAIVFRVRIFPAFPFSRKPFTNTTVPGSPVPTSDTETPDTAPDLNAQDSAPSLKAQDSLPALGAQDSLPAPEPQDIRPALKAPESDPGPEGSGLKSDPEGSKFRSGSNSSGLRSGLEGS
jgi:hypothetical protein